MDMGFKSYVVLKAISMTEGTKEQSALSKLMSNSIRQNSEVSGEILDDINLWKYFYSISTKEIEEIINELIQRKIIYSKTVQVEGKRSLILFLTSKGKKILHILDRKYYYVINENTFTNNKNWDIIKEGTSIIYNYSSYQLYNVSQKIKEAVMI